MYGHILLAHISLTVSSRDGASLYCLTPVSKIGFFVLFVPMSVRTVFHATSMKHAVLFSSSMFYCTTSRLYTCTYGYHTDHFGVLAGDIFMVYGML